MFLEYGVNEAGELVYIDQVRRGQLDDVFCPYCGSGLTAKKGRIKAHHFAHTGDTCNPTQRDQDVIALPAFDRFDMHLKPRELEALRDFHTKSIITPRYFERLKQRGLVEYDQWQRGHTLTDTGKIVFGQLTLAKFAVYQDRKFKHKDDHLLHIAQHATPGPEQGQAITDLRLYRAQWQRVLSASLYFLEIEHAGGKAYKIGMTTRPLEDRIAEIEADLKPIWGHTLRRIEPLRVLSHRGAVELYFMHRYRANRHPLVNLTEYFKFSSRRNVLSDLTRLGDKELLLHERAILVGDMLGIKQDTVTPPPVPASSPKQDSVTVITPTHEREMPVKKYTFDCARCGQCMTLRRYPGRRPTLCDDCAAERKREQTRERVRRYRKRKRQRGAR